MLQSTSCLKWHEGGIFAQDKQDSLSTIDNHPKLLRLTALNFTFNLWWFSSVEAALLLHKTMEQKSIYCNPVAQKNNLTN